MQSRFKLFSDPVHGFISVPKASVLPLIETPEFQRLRRIRQLGLGHLVYPGAEHTRFQHALGAMALMQEALTVITEKGAVLSEDEHDAALTAALLHDIGHGPFSHTLEQDLIGDDETGCFHHERMSRVIIERLNDRLGGALDQALAIFDGTHPQRFLHTLIASQLDMDRLDYLRRDSFFTGVAEGVVGVERIIKTLRVHASPGGGSPDIVIEAKGAYAVESYILSRRLMYWQVYLHKTVVAADHLLRSAFARARDQVMADDDAVKRSSPSLLFFLQERVTLSQIAEQEVVDAFCNLDDTDILMSLKAWLHSSDPILADLARRFVERDLFRTVYLPHPPSAEQVEDWRDKAASWLVDRGIARPAAADASAPLYVCVGHNRVSAYTDREDSIRILERDGRVRTLSETAEVTDIARLAVPVERHYVCLPKDFAALTEPPA